MSSTWDDSLAVSPDALERQLSWLVRAGWSGSTFGQAAVHRVRAKTLVITFDDAYKSVIKLAQPILAQLSLPATVFAPTHYVSTARRFAWPGVDHWLDTAHAGELEPMTWQDLGTLAGHGWEVASHTRTHPRLTQLSEDDLDAELHGSREEQRAQLGFASETIAYPYFDVDERVAAHAAAAGYVAGAAGWNKLSPADPHRWPRVAVFRKDRSWRFRLKTWPTGELLLRRR